MTHRPQINLLVVLLVGLLSFCNTSCESTGGPASASFASVTIQNHSPEEIAAAAMQVFGADGYTGGITGAHQLVFEKEASRGTTIAREGLVRTQAGAVTLIRVRAEIVNLSGGSFRLQCKAYTVSGGSDPFFQDEVALTNIRSGPYQSLLNKVAQQLK